MTKPTKLAIAEMTNAIMTDLAIIRPVLDFNNVVVQDAWAGVESFVAIALQVFAQTNHSKLREVMRLIEIHARMDGREVID